MRKLLAVTLAASLLLVTGCGAAADAGATTGVTEAGDVGPLSSLQLTPGADDTSDPTVTIKTPLEATKAGAKMILAGGGETIKENQSVTYKTIAFKTEDGSQLGSNFESEGDLIPTVPEMKTAMPEFYDVIVGSKVGSYIAFLQPTPTEPGATAPAEPANIDTLIVIKTTKAVDIPPTPPTPEFKKSDDKSVKKATGSISADGKISVTLPAGKADPAKLEVTVLKEGDGPAATKDSTVVAHYIGARLEDGKVFDGSYSRGEPSEFPLSGVIKGWTEGLTGIKQGSTVLLSIPTDMAYGKDAAAMGKPAGPLVFIVELQEVK
ncbi:FKBP-type peptidyl-prolyl cis-trans isomerase [Paeniglutamicibacter cryotolerans]|uniref:FKBP-type peptidyl-prolyl cis-trans isomerase n=1 Tax=Paeniglutamicibacter cryotolerans TaxID=670079 RepID=UPI00161B499A|nr:FKBP-type peptidyl-prolyl cis-trans isomerase [Paeniglutamicibacter cryotolerans]